MEKEREGGREVEGGIVGEESKKKLQRGKVVTLI